MHQSSVLYSSSSSSYSFRNQFLFLSILIVFSIVAVEILLFQFRSQSNANEYSDEVPLLKNFDYDQIHSVFIELLRDYDFQTMWNKKFLVPSKKAKSPLQTKVFLSKQFFLTFLRLRHFVV